MTQILNKRAIIFKGRTLAVNLDAELCIQRIKLSRNLPYLILLKACISDNPTQVSGVALELY